MNREEFFKRLFSCLGNCSEEEKNRIEEYYTELFMDETDEGTTEEEVIGRFGTPEDIAKQIREEQELRHENKEQCLEEIPADGQGGCYRARGPVTWVQIFAQDTPVRIYPASDGIFKIFYRKYEAEQVTVREENGCYTFRHEIPLLTRILSFWRIGRESIRVEVPRDGVSNLEVVTSNGRVSADDFSGFRFCRLNTSNGKVMIRNLVGETLESRSSNGSITVGDCRTKRLEVQSSNGRISCTDCKGEKISLRTSNGGIEVKSLDSGDIMIKSSNASIRGTVVGNIRDYAMDCRTSNGSCNLPTWGDQHCTAKLYAHTSNAPIKLEFVEKR